MPHMYCAYVPINYTVPEPINNPHSDPINQTMRRMCITDNLNQQNVL